MTSGAANPMSEAIILTASDLRPLRDNPEAMGGALDAIENALITRYQGGVREQRIVDRRPGEFEGIRVALMAGDDLLSGMRIFGNPPHTRAFMLFDGETRAMLALMDYGVLNSMRVGAIAGVATKYLAPKDAHTVGLLGSGWQAPMQLHALTRAVPAIDHVKVYSRTPANREKFAAEMTARLRIPVVAVDSVKAALDGVDIVDICAPGHFDVREPLFEPEWVRPGALAVSMASNQYSAAFITQCRVCAASFESLTEGNTAVQPYGELMQQGRFTKDDVTELGAVITKGIDPRRTPEDTVIYHLEGGSAQDLFLATWGYEWAKANGLGKPFDLSA